MESGHLLYSVFHSNKFLLVGSAPRAKYTMAGSGVLDATQFQSGEVDACLTGSGQMQFVARDTMSAVMTGSGTISYTGKPTVTRRCTSGSGRIHGDN